MDRVFVTKEIPGIERLSSLSVGVWDGPGPVPYERLMDESARADGLLTMLTDRVDRALVDDSPRLRVISQMAVGVDNVDVAHCVGRGIALGHTPEVLTETVADSAFALLAAVVRRLPEGWREVAEGRWGAWEPYHLAGGDLHGTTLGIVGMGRIGQAVARRARGFEMTVLYASPRAAPADLGARVALPELLSRADHVVVCARLDDATRGLIGERELSTMKPTAHLVNVARGAVVDTDSLVRALEEGWIAAAALDVTDPEPLPADHPLVRMDNCLVVPHIASASVRTRDAMAALAIENLLAGIEGRPMPARYEP